MRISTLKSLKYSSKTPRRPKEQLPRAKQQRRSNFDVFIEILSLIVIIHLTNNMIKISKNHPLASCETIQPNSASHPLKRTNKLSIQTVNTTRTLQSKALAHRLQTQPHKMEVTVPFQDEWEETFNRRENFLNAMFNRRKTVLENISKRNRDIYMRISNQESHYPHNKQKEEINTKSKGNVENLTANSRLMLTLSKHALNNSNLLGIKLPHNTHNRDKENLIKISDGDLNEKRVGSKQLAPIIENAETSAAMTDFKIIESRFIKDDAFHRCQLGKTRNRSVGRARITDVYTNF